MNTPKGNIIENGQRIWTELIGNSRLVCQTGPSPTQSAPQLGWQSRQRPATAGSYHHLWTKRATGGKCYLSPWELEHREGLPCGSCSCRTRPTPGTWDWSREEIPNLFLPCPQILTQHSRNFSIPQTSSHAHPTKSKTKPIFIGSFFITENWTQINVYPS